MSKASLNIVQSRTGYDLIKALWEEKQMNDSYFDGGLLGLIGWYFFGFLLTIASLGILYPFAVVLVVRWRVEHTVINGRRLAFDGTATQLFGNWLLWLFLIIITLGIYGFWVGIAMKKWEVKHTHFAN